MKVSWDDDSQYMEKENMFQTTKQYISGLVFTGKLKPENPKILMGKSMVSG